MKLTHLFSGLFLSLSLALIPAPAHAQDAVGGGPVAHTPGSGADPTDFDITVDATPAHTTFGVVTADGASAVGHQLISFFHGPWGVAFDLVGLVQRPPLFPRDQVLLRVYLLRNMTNPATGEPDTRVLIIVFNSAGQAVLRLDGFLDSSGEIVFS